MNDLSKWLENKSSYEKGVDLYAKYCSGNSNFEHFSNLFKSFNNSFTREKLISQLQDVYHSEKDVVEVFPSPIFDNKLDAPFDVKEYLLKIENDMRSLFKETINIRNTLINKCQDELKFTGIPLKRDEVLSQMNRLDRMGRPIPFQIAYVTCDLRTSEGGVIKIQNKMVITRPNKTGTKSIKASNNEVHKLSSKPANHWKNSTRNIRHIYGNEVFKININLIIQFNGRLVTIAKTA